MLLKPLLYVKAPTSQRANFHWRQRIYGTTVKEKKSRALNLALIWAKKAEEETTRHELDYHRWNTLMPDLLLQKFSAT